LLKSETIRSTASRSACEFAACVRLTRKLSAKQ
jgi:hypothetical protein